MMTKTRRDAFLIAAGAAAFAAGAAQGAPISRSYVYKAAPIDNPLKGLVPYAGDVGQFFPHSMQFDYLPVNAVVRGPIAYDWSALEAILAYVAAQGRQSVFRFYLEYPGKPRGVPDYLVKAGLKFFRYQMPGTPPINVETPDYRDPKLRALMLDFIAALGARYDGDPRIGFVTAGVLGSWGEWHNWPRPDLFAAKLLQTEVLDAYARAFAKTKVLLRYPAGANDSAYAQNDDRAFGYHDDSFAWATLKTGAPGTEWHFMALLENAGRRALDKWKTEPIGGEIRPEAWGKVFDASPGDPSIQNFRACVDATRVSWLMDSGMFAPGQPAARIANARREVRRMGYEFHVPSAAFASAAAGAVQATVDVVNRGIAPFYYDWPVEIGLLRGGAVVKARRTAARMSGLLPGAPARRLSLRLGLAGVSPGDYSLAIRVANPMTGGRPLRFANETQDKDAPGWLTLGPVRVQ
jgi:hypothetical protein